MWAWCIIVVAVTAMVGTLVYSATRPAPSSNVVSNPPELPSPLDGKLVLTPPANGPLVVSFYGDSITDGYYASTPANTYRAKLISHLNTITPTVDSGIWIPGARVEKVAVRAPEMSPRTGLIVVQLGTNDANSPRTPISQFDRQYTLFLTSLRASSNAPMVCFGTWLGTDFGRELDGEIMRACEAHGGSFISLAGTYNNMDVHGPAGRRSVGGTSDVFHPNDLGHAEIAKRVLRTLAFNNALVYQD